MPEWLNVVGEISNAISSVCAVIAIVITLVSYRKTNDEAKYLRGIEQEQSLYKDYVIDSFLKSIDETVESFYQNLYIESKKKNYDEQQIEDLYNQFLAQARTWGSRVDVVKEVAEYNHYRQFDKLLDEIVEQTGNEINQISTRKRVGFSSGQDVVRKATELRIAVLKYYNSIN